jgi:spore coat protein U-like protein
MQKLMRMAVAGALAAVSSLALAADDFSNIAVTATVAGVCKLSAPATLNIIADPLSGLAAENTAAISFKCTKNHPYTLSVAQGAGSLTNGATTPVTSPFTATWAQPSGTGIGFSTPVSADLKVSIAASDYEDKPAGSYAATLKVNINY